MAARLAAALVAAALLLRGAGAIKLAKEGERCNGSLPPEYAVLCEEGLECRSATGLLGAWGVCTRPEPAAAPAAPAAPAASPRRAKAGERCNGSLPPQQAVLCEDGLSCQRPALLGAWGVCTEAREARPAEAKEGEKCNGSLPPRFAVLCEDGLHCATALIGGWGRCAREGAPAPRLAAEGERCNGSLPPGAAVLCASHLRCETPRLLGAWGVCRRPAAAAGASLVSVSGGLPAPWALALAAALGFALATATVTVGARSSRRWSALPRLPRRRAAVPPAAAEGYLQIQ